MKRKISAILLVALLLGMVVVPTGAFAAKKKIKLLKVTEDGARLREGPGSTYDVKKSIKKGSIVLYLGKTKNSFRYISTSKGTKGYIYKGFLKTYGTCYSSQVYYVKKSKLTLYKKPSTKSKKIARLSKKQRVIVSQVKGSWAYIKTLSGTGGYVKKSGLKKA